MSFPVQPSLSNMDNELQTIVNNIFTKVCQGVKAALHCIHTTIYQPEYDQVIMKCDRIVQTLDVVCKYMDDVHFLDHTKQLDTFRAKISKMEDEINQCKLIFLDMIRELHQIMCIQNKSTGIFEKTMWEFVGDIRKANKYECK